MRLLLSLQIWAPIYMWFFVQCTVCHSKNFSNFWLRIDGSLWVWQKSLSLMFSRHSWYLKFLLMTFLTESYQLWSMSKIAEKLQTRVSHWVKLGFQNNHDLNMRIVWWDQKYPKPVKRSTLGHFYQNCLRASYQNKNAL